MYPPGWGRATLRLDADPQPAAVAWAERLHGRTGADELRRLLHAISRDLATHARGASLRVAGLRLHAIGADPAQPGRLVAEGQVDAIGRTVQASATACDPAHAVARLYLHGLERVGAPIDRPGDAQPVAREVVLEDAVLRAALRRSPLVGAVPVAVESWRLCGARIVASAARLGLRVNPRSGADSVFLAHYTTRYAPRGADGAIRAWSAAALRAAARAGLADAPRWAFAAVVTAGGRLP